MMTEVQAHQSRRFWRILLGGFAFIYPLIFLVLPSTELSWALPKVIMLVAIGLLGLLRLRETPPGWAAFPLLLTGFFALVLLSGLFAYDEWIYTILGDRRVDGVLYHVGLVLFGLLVYVCAREDDALPMWVIGNLIAGGVVQALIIPLQLLFPRIAIGGFSISFEELLVGTLGHSGYVGGLLLPILLLGLALFWRSSGRRLLLVGVGLFVIAFGLGLTGNRSAFFALLVAMALVVATRPPWRSWLLVTSLLFTVLGSNQATQTIRSLTADSARAVQKSYLNTNTLETRFEIWRLAIEAAAKTPGQPFVGGGPSGFNLALSRYFEPEQFLPFYQLEFGWPPPGELVAAHKVETAGSNARSNMFFYSFSDDRTVLTDVRVDRAHNLFLDRLVSYGALSVLIWLVLYLYPIYVGLRSYDLRQQGFAWALVAVFVYYQAWFPVPQIEPIHLMIAAIAWAIPVDVQKRAKAEGAEAAAVQLEG